MILSKDLLKSTLKKISNKEPSPTCFDEAQTKVHPFDDNLIIVRVTPTVSVIMTPTATMTPTVMVIMTPTVKMTPTVMVTMTPTVMTMI